MTASVTARGRLSACRAAFVLLCCALALASQPSAWGAETITRVDIRPDAGETVIAIFTSSQQSLEVKSFSLEEPPRLVFDLLDAELDPQLPDSFSVVAPALERVRLGQFSVDPPIARVVVDLAADSPLASCETDRRGVPGETLIVLRNAAPIVLGLPTVETVEGAVLVRMLGVGKLHHSVAVLSDPPRVYADVTDAVIEEAYCHEYEQGAVREIRMGQQPADPLHPVARVVVELHEEQAYTAYPDGPDLILAVAPQPWALPLPRYEAAARLKGKRVVIDPGHGGEDTGAPAFFGPPQKGPLEKDIVLDIGLRLAQLLKAEGASVTLTRDDDTDLSLKQRAAIANRLRSKAFVSIHCNSCDKPNTLHGTSVYYDHRHSMGFARLVQDELLAALGTEDKGVRNANFAVIRRVKGPGILVETAFINHEDDRAGLVHPVFRERTARAVLRGLIRYLDGEPDGGAAG
jgi:N-acetylmuramoyl-L-alanine amidase